MGSSYSTFMFLKPAKAPFVPLCSFSSIEQKQPSSVGGTKYFYICIHSISSKGNSCLAHIVYYSICPQYNPNFDLHHQIRNVEIAEIKMCDPNNTFKAVKNLQPCYKKLSLDNKSLYNQFSGVMEVKRFITLLPLVDIMIAFLIQQRAFYTSAIVNHVDIAWFLREKTYF